MKVFKGTIMNCFRHYAENNWPVKGGRNSDDAKRLMAEFVDVQTTTIAGWQYRNTVPGTLELVKLGFYLKSENYDIVEFHSLDKPSFMLAELMAYGVLSPEQSTSELNYQKSDSSYRIIRGVTKLDKFRSDKIEDLYRKLSVELSSAKILLASKLENSKKSYFEIIESTPSSSVLPMKDSVARSREIREENAPREVVQSREKELEINDQLISTVAHLVNAITPLLERVVEETTQEQRRTLRELTGGNGMWKLSKASSKLCSEKAREVITNDEQQATQQKGKSHAK